MAEIIHIRSGEPVDRPLEPSQDVIAMLQKMLEAATCGRLQAVIVVGWNADNSISSGWVGAYNAAFTLLGGLEEVKHEYLLKEFQRR